MVKHVDMARHSHVIYSVFIIVHIISCGECTVYGALMLLPRIARFSPDNDVCNHSAALVSFHITQLQFFYALFEM